MPVYEYKGINKKGKHVNGLVDADNSVAAKARLRKEGIFPTHLAENSSGEIRGSKKGAGFARKRLGGNVSVKDVATMTRQLATLVGAHVPLVEALTALVEQTDNVKLKGVLSNIKDSVNQGSSLGNAMESYPTIFSNMFINMVKAGEASGALDIVLLRLADFAESQVRLKNKIISTMAYPILMLIIGIIVLIGLFTFVIPKITGIFESVNMVLPIPTRILLGISGSLTGYWYVFIIVFVLLFYVLRKYINSEKGRPKYHAFLLNVPLFGRLFRLVAISRFASTLSTLLSSGVPMLSALQIVKSLMNNVILRSVVRKTVESIEEGDSLAEPLRISGEFPPLVTHMIAVGERTGTLEDMLKKVADTYENEVDSTITIITSLLEPIMIAASGVVIGFVVIAVLLPIFKMTSMVR